MTIDVTLGTWACHLMWSCDGPRVKEEKLCVCVFFMCVRASASTPTAACVYQCELGCSTLSPTSDGGIWTAAEEEDEVGGEPLRLPEEVVVAVTAGRMSGGGGWLWGALFWSGRVWRGGGWRRRLGGAEGGAGRSSGGGWEKEDGAWAEEGGEELPVASEGGSSILTWRGRKETDGGASGGGANRM